MGDWTANPHRCRYGCADGIRNYQLYGLRARDILNHQLKREGCAEGTALFFHFSNLILCRFQIIVYLCRRKVVPWSVAGVSMTREESPGSIGHPTCENASSR